MPSDSYAYRAYSETNNGLFGISVKSCGHVFAKKGRKISRPLGRGDWLLFYAFRGVERFYLDKETDLRAGDFLFFKPNEPQEHICILENTCEFYYVHFNAPKDFDLFGFESSRVYNALPSYQVKELFEEMISELQAKKPCYEKMSASFLFSILSVLKRKCEGKEEIEKRHSSEISSAVQLISKEYSKNRSLMEYAEMFRMSKFHFLRVFKDITDMTPMEYRTKIRLEHAGELLSDSALSICEISSRLGFSSQSYFCDAFKKHFGESPTAYRKSLHKK